MNYKLINDFSKGFRDLLIPPFGLWESASLCKRNPAGQEAPATLLVCTTGLNGRKCGAVLWPTSCRCNPAVCVANNNNLMPATPTPPPPWRSDPFTISLLVADLRRGFVVCCCVWVFAHFFACDRKWRNKQRQQRTCVWCAHPGAPNTPLLLGRMFLEERRRERQRDINIDAHTRIMNLTLQTVLASKSKEGSHLTIWSLVVGGVRAYFLKSILQFLLHQFVALRFHFFPPLVCKNGLNFIR